VPIVVYEAEAPPAFKPAPSPKLVRPIPKPAQPATPKAPTTSAISSHLAALDAIQTKFDDIRSAFVFPSYVEFALAAASPATPKLLYNSINATVLHYESELIKLLTRLDAIESGGAEAVRGARKALVLAVEEELDQLEQAKDAAWTRQQQREEPAVPSQHATEVEESGTAPEVQTGEPATEPEREEGPAAVPAVEMDGSGGKADGECAGETAPTDASDANQPEPEPTPSQSINVDPQSSQPEPVSHVSTDYKVEEVAPEVGTMPVEEAVDHSAAAAEGSSEAADVPQLPRAEPVPAPVPTSTDPLAGQADAKANHHVEAAGPSTEQADARNRSAEGDRSSGNDWVRVQVA
jgi:hypothetical protein